MMQLVISQIVWQEKRESKTRWDVFTPQYPKRIVFKEIDQITGLNKVTLKYKPPTVLKHIPLMPIQQHFSKDFVMWYYDLRTAEAVMLLKDKRGEYKKIHIFDPMWLINCLYEDIIMLYYNPIYYEEKDREQALK